MNSKIKFEIVKADYQFEALTDQWVDRCACLADDLSTFFDSVMERVLKEVGPARVAHIKHSRPPNRSMRREIIGHDGELLGEVWIEWPDRFSDKYEITVKGRYRAK